MTSRSKPSQKERLFCIREYAQMLGAEQILILRCGCARIEWDTGTKRNYFCDKHRFKYPRSCRCGYVQKLVKLTARAQKIGDIQRVAELRAERAAHKCKDEGGK